MTNYRSLPVWKAHSACEDFDGVGLAAIRALRVLSRTEWRTVREAVRLSEDHMGEGISEASMRNGFYGLMYAPREWETVPEEERKNEWNTVRVIATPGFVPLAVERGAGGQLSAQLTDAGEALRQRSLEVFPPQSEIPEAEVEEPPRPQTPLWRVLTDEGGAVVVAASAERALELVGEEAVRAEPIDTSAEKVVWV
jgi:hypothetical protein